MKYKVGDKVRVREDLKKISGVYKDIDTEEIEGKEVEIDRILEKDGLYSVLLENGDNWLVTEEAIVEDELGFNFTISKFPKDSLEARRNTLIMLFAKILERDGWIREQIHIDNADRWCFNDTIDIMKDELELFKRRIYDGK